MTREKKSDILILAIFLVSALSWEEELPESIAYFKNSFDVEIPESYNFLEEYPQCDFGPLLQECGSCFAYGPLKSLSHRICRASGKKTLLSAQYFVACDVLDSGCNGGCSRTAMYFLEQHGVSDISCHPWQNVQNYSSEFCSKCVNGSDAYLYKTKIGSTRQLTSVNAIKEEIYIYGPVAASVETNPKFKAYKGGIYKAPFTDWTTARTHSVEIIGWGVENGEEYWIVLNQYGIHWGENGRIRIGTGRDYARIESYVYAADPV